MDNNNEIKIINNKKIKLSMKKMMMAMALCLVCALSFTSCESKLEKQVRKEYFTENIVPGLTIVKLVDKDAEVKIESVKQLKDFNETITESDFYKETVIDSIQEEMDSHKKYWLDTYNYECLWESIIPIDWNKLNKIKSKVDADSCALKEATLQYEAIKNDDSVKYNVCQFAIKTKSKIMGETNESIDTVIVLTSPNNEFVKFK